VIEILAGIDHAMQILVAGGQLTKSVVIVRHKAGQESISLV
jgi:hypothetical protein